MQLNSRQILLFIFSCALLIYAHTPGGALLALGVLMQLALLIYNIEFSKKSQLAALKLFLVTTPLFLFWGGVHSFATIYFNEGQYLFFFMTVVLILILSFLLCLQIVFSFWFLKPNDYNLLGSLQDSFNAVKNRKKDFIKTSLLLFIFSFVPGLSADWKLVFALMATYFYLNLSQLKKALLNL